MGPLEPNHRCRNGAPGLARPVAYAPVRVAASDRWERTMLKSAPLA